MSIRLLLTAAALPLTLAAASTAHASGIAPGSVIVRFQDSATHSDRIDVVQATGTGSATPLPGGSRELRIEDGESVAETLAELRAEPEVASARPNYLLHAAAKKFIPNDRGRAGPGDWREVQWNFAGPFGIRAPEAWATMRGLDKDGGRGVVVAVIDSGVAYRDKGNFKRAPDLYRGRFEEGWDFVENDRYPLDEDSHGTHVTGTIAEHVNNKKAVTGIAYGVRIMPVRVLDANGNGKGATFARAIKWSANHGADVINMSVEFDVELRAADIPEVIKAIRYAHDKGAVMVASAGNDSVDRLQYPAREKSVISVGATTSHGCKAEYSNTGSGLDLTAPGGGGDASPASSAWDQSHCDPLGGERVVYQQTFVANPRDFHLVGFEGTSESAPHVSAVAALVLASGRVGSNPSPDTVLARIAERTRDIGAPGRDNRYGAGLLDAAAAVAP